MNRKLVVWAGPALVLMGLAAQRTEGKSQDEKPEGLVRVAPVPVQEEETDDPFDRIFRKTFSREQWAEWLAVPDLDVREQYYTDLLRRARIDPVARAFVEKLAQDEARPDLAWTARLALRELGRADFPFLGLAPDRFGLDRTLEDVLTELGGSSLLELFARPRHRMRILPHLTPPGASSSSMSFEQGPDGAKIVITEIVDGEDSTREYTGESLEEILRDNPELSEDVEGGLRFHLRLPGEGRVGQWTDVQKERNRSQSGQYLAERSTQISAGTRKRRI